MKQGSTMQRDEQLPGTERDDWPCRANQGAEDQEAEIKRLRDEIERLRDEIERLRDEIERLRDEIERLRARVADLEAANDTASAKSDTATTICGASGATKRSQL
jgi:predicted  nucleic acid-binding Zn-ribbon protein